MTSTLGGSAGEFVLGDRTTVQEAETAAALMAEEAGKRAVTRSLEDRASLRKKWMRRYALLLFGADALTGLAATSVAYYSKRWVSHHNDVIGYLGDKTSYPRLAGLSVLAWLAMLALFGAYRSKHVASDERDYMVPIKSAFQLIAVIAVASYIFHTVISRWMMMTFFATLVVGVVVCRGFVNLLLRQARARGRARARVLLMGEARSVQDLADHLLSRPDPRCDIVALCTTGTARSVTIRGIELPVAGTPDEVVDAVHAVRADSVLVANPSGLTTMTLQQIAWQLERDWVDLLVVPDTVALAGPRLRVSSLRELPVLQVSHPRHESLLRSLSVGLFRLAAALLLLLASPLFLTVAVAIKVGSTGPVFYRQRRIGYRGQEFEMLKFRSMVPDAEQLLPSLVDLNEHDGALFKIKDDPRVTRVGRFLRKYSLDELPQLWNVVRGKMTLVGPRPCLAREMTMFGEAEHRRFMVRPGMTGLWQVSGGPDLAWSDAVKTDLYYVDNWSPALDMSILARTVRVVATGSGH